MKIRVLIPKWDILGYQLLVKTLNVEKCKWFLVEDVKDYITFIIYTDSEYVRKYIYRNCYYERLVDDEKEENNNKLEKRTFS